MWSASWRDTSCSDFTERATHLDRWNNMYWRIWFRMPLLRRRDVQGKYWINVIGVWLRALLSLLSWRISSSSPDALAFFTATHARWEASWFIYTKAIRTWQPTISGKLECKWCSVDPSRGRGGGGGGGGLVCCMGFITCLCECQPHPHPHPHSPQLHKEDLWHRFTAACAA